jgi:dolichyl-phosphate-mannose--protein O-mannosyl transferase
VLGDNDGRTEIFAGTSRVRLINKQLAVALRLSGKALPDWGFHQYEVVADTSLDDVSVVWVFDAIENVSGAVFFFCFFLFCL